MSELTWHGVGTAEEQDVGYLRRVEVDGAAVCLGRTAAGWVAFQDTCTHEECSLADGELEGNVVVCPCHASEFDLRTGDVLCPPALEPLPIYEARIEEGELQVRLAPPPAAAEAVHAREDHVSEAVARAATTAGPSLDGLALDDVDLTDLDVWEEGVPYELAHAPSPRGAALLAARGGRPRLLGLHPLRRHRPGVEGLGDVLVRDGRDLARGPDAGGGRGAQVDARHRPAGAHAPSRPRQQGLHAARRQHLRGADPRPRPRDPRAGLRARQLRLGRGRRLGDPDVGVLGDHGPAGRRPAAADRARRQAARQHRSGGRRRGERPRPGGDRSVDPAAAVLEPVRARPDRLRLQARRGATHRSARRRHDQARRGRDRRLPALASTSSGSSSSCSRRRGTRRRGTRSASACSTCSRIPRRRRASSPIRRSPAPPPTRSSAARTRCITSGAPPTRDVTVHGRRIKAGDKVTRVVRLGQLRRGEVRRPVPLRRRPRTRTGTSRSASAGRTSASARTSRSSR